MIDEELSKLGAMIVVFSRKQKNCINCQREWKEIRDFIKKNKRVQTLLNINWNARKLNKGGDNQWQSSL